MTKHQNNNTSIREVYGLITETRKEFGEAILRVENKVEAIAKSFNDFEAGRLSTLEKDFAEIKAKHAPIEKIVYGMVALILTSVLGALLYLVIK